jgi:hypothetical protein
MKKVMWHKAAAKVWAFYQENRVLVRATATNLIRVGFQGSVPLATK